MVITPQASLDPVEPDPGRPLRRVTAVVAVMIAVGVGVAVLVVGRTGERRPATEPVELTITGAEARAVVDEFVGLLNAGEVDAAFGLVAADVVGRPERIDGLDVDPMKDFAEEVDYLRWLATLRSDRRLGDCAVERWVHLVDGMLRPENARLLRCSALVTTDFFAAVGFEPLPAGIVVAVTNDREVALYQEWVEEFADTALYLEFRRWLRDHHPEDELSIFTPGGSPLATPEAAAAMLGHAPAFAADREG